MASPGRPAVATIPPGVAFLPQVVECLLAGRLGFRLDAEARDFSVATIYVPTRRAARALAVAFAERLRPGALLLPRIVPLGDPADLEAVNLGNALGGTVPATPVGDLDRRFLLTDLVHAWRGASGLAERSDPSLAESFHLAGDLAGLIDEFHIEEIDWRKVAGIVPDTLDDYWRDTRDFLAIAGEAWPRMLAERGQADLMAIRNGLLLAEARRLTDSRPDAIIVAAGSTGSMPATARLLAAIARLPNGAVILPGLDTGLAEDAFRAVAEGEPGEIARPGHPQTILKRLLGIIGIARADVVVLGAPPPAVAARNRLISEALRPVEATDAWPALREELGPTVPSALAEVSLIEAENERLEALAVAVAIRAALEESATRIALVTPDRALAGAITRDLARWCISAADTAATPLATTRSGALLRLMLAAVLADFSPNATLALLRAEGFGVGEGHEAAVAALELAGLRGALVAPGLAGLRKALVAAPARRADRHAAPPVGRVTDASLMAAARLLERLQTAFAPLLRLPERCEVAELATTLAAAFEALAGEATLEAPDGAHVIGILADLAGLAEGHVAGRAEFARIVELLLSEAAVVPPAGSPGRVSIHGLLEARLIDADTVILAGFSEGRWPPDVRTDAFLNRPMRQQLGLSPPERRIGQSAHDFQMLAGAERLILSRSRQVDGAPMIASRLLRRIEALVGAEALEDARVRGRRWLDLAHLVEAPRTGTPASRPAPRPPAARQPPRLSVTEVERLYRDPYAIHARRVLGLAPLEALEPGLDARGRGDAIHAALAEFIRIVNDGWPADPLALLLRLGRDSFARLGGGVEVDALWLPRFEVTAEWFVEAEKRRRPLVAHSHVEIDGAMTLALDRGASVRLTARADRIDMLKDGTAAIIDYKSGVAPTVNQIQAGYAAQLPLTAAILAAGGFPAIRPVPVSALHYMQVGDSGKRSDRPLELGEATPDRLAAEAVACLRDFLNRLRSGEFAFLSRRAPAKEGHSGDFDHLARVREWVGDDESGEGEA
jgi:ATP-dependent helicase/nuclease subunit B